MERNHILPTKCITSRLLLIRFGPYSHVAVLVDFNVDYIRPAMERRGAKPMIKAT